MEDFFVFSQCADIYIDFLAKNDVVAPPFLKEYLEKIFSTYAILAFKDGCDISITNDLFEHSGTKQRSRTAHSIKKDLNKIASLLTQVQELIYLTEGGQILLSKGLGKHIKHLDILVSSAEHASSSITLSGGRSQSGERRERLDMVLKLRTLAKYYGLSFSLTGHHNQFADTISYIYKVLKIEVTDLGYDFKDISRLYTSEYQQKFFMNFKLITERHQTQDFSSNHP